MRRYLRVLLWFALWLPIAGFAQTTNSTNFSNSTSSSFGATNAVYVFVSTTVGPATVFIDDRGVCTLQGPPFPNCTFQGGTGTAANPFGYTCAPGPPVTGCSSGTPFVLAGGQVDIDVDTHTETAGTNATIVTNSTSSSVGATNAVYYFVTTTIGPQTIFFNALGLCTLQGPPFANCTLGSGTGTAADPFSYSCSGDTGPPVTGCTSGTAFVLAPGQVDINTDLHTETIGAVFAAAPIPLDPWVPIGSALGVALLAVAWQLRRRRS